MLLRSVPLQASFFDEIFTRTYDDDDGHLICVLLLLFCCAASLPLTFKLFLLATGYKTRCVS
jgi:hypothetical protein